jgi:hypothetical protein
MTMLLKLKTLQLSFSSFIAAVSATIGLGSPAFAQSQPIKPGTYSCWTLALGYRSPPAPDSQSEINRRARNLTIDPNSRSIQPAELSLMPAVFGVLVFDGRGRYTIPRFNQSGTYGFDTRRGLPTFTGDLAGFTLVEYSGTGTRFVLGWQGMNFQCGLEQQGGRQQATTQQGARQPAPAPAAAAGPAAVPAGSRSPNAAYVSWVGPKRSSAIASDFNGQFEGKYSCGGVDNHRVRLDLQARPDGTITGVFNFGGMDAPIFGYFDGSYSMKGTWQGTRFVLKSEQWIKQPVGYVMVDVEGDITQRGVAGTVLFSNCDSFAAARVSQ